MPSWKRAFLITGADPSHPFRMTFYRSLSLNAVAKMRNGTVRQSKKSITLMMPCQLSHRGSRSFTFTSGWRLTFLSLWRLAVRRHSERRQKCRVGNLVNETVARSEESITLMTSYRFPHHNSRSFTSASGWRLSLAIILSGVKNGTYKDKTCYVLSPKTAHSKKRFRPSPCGGRRKRFSDRILFLCHSKSVCPFFRHTPLRFHVT